MINLEYKVLLCKELALIKDRAFEKYMKDPISSE